MVKILPDTANRILLPFILLVLISLPASGFTKGDSFDNYTADMIYKECNGKNIILKPNILINQKNVTLLEWPYPKENIKRIVQIFSPMDFNTHQYGEGLSDNRPDGLGLIKCENNNLDIIGRIWYWNGIEIIPPQKTDITNLNQTVDEKTFIKIGDISFSLLGGVSVISISFISITLIGALILRKMGFEIVYKTK
ncbi:MAG: hypothetical protein WA144_11540 [Candidatus Methanoperedens sp.]